MSFYEQAKHYIDNFGWSVIPIRADGSKEPAVNEVIPYRSRYATDQELQEWFVYQNNYLGIVTGKLSNLTVVDVDGPSAPKVSSPIWVKTRKGRHYYFRYQEGIGNHVRPLPDLDIRTENGYVVAPPTINYQWGNDTGHIGELPIFPIDLLERIKAATNGGKKVNPPGWFGEAIKNLKEGNRNATFARLVGSLHSQRFLPSDILALLIPVAASVNFGERELRSIVNSITQYANSQNGVGAESIADFMKEIQPVEWLVPKLVAKGAFQFVAGLPETFKTWLVFDLAVEAARGGGLWLGKFPVSEARVYILDQERFKGETQRRLGAILREKGLTPTDLNGRLYVQCGSNVKLNIDISLRTFLNDLKAMQPDIVIIDSFAKIHTLNENSDQDMNLLNDIINKLRRELKCTMIFLTHEGKYVYHNADDKGPSAFDMTGSVQKSAAAEIVLTVKKDDPETSTVYVTKNTLSSKLPGTPVTVKDTDKGMLVAAKE